MLIAHVVYLECSRARFLPPPSHTYHQGILVIDYDLEVSAYSLVALYRVLIPLLHASLAITTPRCPLLSLRTELGDVGLHQQGVKDTQICVCCFACAKSSTRTLAHACVWLSAELHLLELDPHDFRRRVRGVVEAVRLARFLNRSDPRVDEHHWRRTVPGVGCVLTMAPRHC